MLHSKLQSTQLVNPNNSIPVYAAREENDRRKNCTVLATVNSTDHTARWTSSQTLDGQHQASRGEQCSRKRARQLKKRKKSCFLDFEENVKNVKNVQKRKKRTGRSTQPIVSQAA